MSYHASDTRYDKIAYARCGASGLKLPPLSLGLWHNFGGNDDAEAARELALFAFDEGITHFDLANNYGPPPGSAESLFGKLLAADLAPYRDELIVTTKAGYDMWPGPYGEWGSKKYLTASLDQSLRRLGLDYVDIFYSHRPDPDTPIEETADALELAVRSGKALYVGLSNYDADQTRAAHAELARRGIRCVIHQPRYSMLDRRPENGLFDALDELGMGAVVFSPLEQGLLSDRYLGGIPEGSRVRKSQFLSEAQVQAASQIAVSLNELAKERGQTLAQMALAWALRRPTVVSAIIGASSTRQVAENLRALDNRAFSEAELTRIDASAMQKR